MSALGSINDSILRETRKQIKNATGNAPVDHRAEQYIERLMDLRKRMNAAKLAAMDEAAKPFLEEMREIEEEAAVYLKLSS